MLPIRHHLFALQELLGRIVQASPVAGENVDIFTPADAIHGFWVN